MIRGWLLALGLICAPMAAAAQPVLPALYNVTGVAAGDVLNIRAEPRASAAILGSLPRNAKAVEVVGLSADGKWASVNTGEGSGYVALRFLARQSGGDWGALQAPLHCLGTEPFWSLKLNPAKATATFSDPDSGPQKAKITALWPGTAYRNTAAISVKGGGLDGLAALRASSCSDGMSDRSYGITVDLFLRDPSGGASASYSGCCSLLP